MCSTSAAAEPREPVPIEAPYAGRPRRGRLVQLAECLDRTGGVVEGFVLDRAPAEVDVDAAAEHTDDEVAEAPGDRGDGGPGAGSQKYSSSVSPSKHGRNCWRQCQSSWSRSWLVQSIAVRVPFIASSWLVWPIRR